ncbi:MAG: hypothetical protein ABJU46_18005 [Paracoccaceae bacterium]
MIGFKAIFLPFGSSLFSNKIITSDWRAQRDRGRKALPLAEWMDDLSFANMLKDNYPMVTDCYQRSKEQPSFSETS